MKIVSTNKENNTGVLEVITNSAKKTSLTFPLDTVLDWYPCSFRYELRYSVPRRKLFVVPVEEIYPSDPARACLGSRYCVIDDRPKYRAKSTEGAFLAKDWYCVNIADENRRIIQFAERIGINVDAEDYTLSDIEEHIKKVLDTMDTTFKMQEEVFLEKCQAGEPVVINGVVRSEDYWKEKRRDYLEGCREERAVIVLSCCNWATEGFYDSLGELYTLLCLLRKVVK